MTETWMQSSFIAKFSIKQKRRSHKSESVRFSNFDCNLGFREHTERCGTACLPYDFTSVCLKCYKH